MFRSTAKWAAHVSDGSKSDWPTKAITSALVRIADIGSVSETVLSGRAKKFTSRERRAGGGLLA